MYDLTTVRVEIADQIAEQDMTLQIGTTEDAAEAMRAFMEKRKPVFHGR